MKYILVKSYGKDQYRGEFKWGNKLVTKKGCIV